MITGDMPEQKYNITYLVEFHFHEALEMITITG